MEIQAQPQVEEARQTTQNTATTKKSGIENGDWILAAVLSRLTFEATK